MKTCYRCKLDFDLSHFRKDPSKKDGRASYCKNCLKETQRIWYHDNKEQARQTASESYHRRKDKVSARRKELRKLDPEKYRAQARSKYCPLKSKQQGWKYAGIVDMTLERYNSLLEKQNYSCAVCGIHQDSLKKALCVDHNHATGKARGLLCDNCNRALGYLQESETVINNLLNYLVCHK